MREIKTYIKERIEKARQTYESGHPKCLLDYYIQSCSKPDTEDLVSGTVKPVLGGHSKIYKTKVLKTNGSLIKVESIAECSLGAFCNTFDLHKVIIGLEQFFLVFF